MRVVIVGAGEVGSTVAASLAGDHEVIVIDLDSERVDTLTYSLDVLAVEGDGASVKTLREAGIDDADLLIACTDDDETNIVSCGTAKTISDAFTIARIRNTKFLDTWSQSEGALGIDLMVGTNLLAAQSIVRVIGLPGAEDVDRFADGLIQMAEFRITDETPVTGMSVAEADTFDSLTFAAIIRDEEVVIPSGDTCLRDGDDVVVIGSPESISDFARGIEPDTDGVSDVLIVGGNEIGLEVARLLGEKGTPNRLVEPDPERARYLAETLPKTTVLENDPTDQEFLLREHIGDVDVAIATLDSDERNLLSALLSKRLGAARSIAVVENGDYSDLFEAVGVDIAVNPREAIAEEITRFTREQHAENVAIIEHDRAEVIEVEVDSGSVLLDRPISQSIRDLPDGVVIGAIARDGTYVIPRGDTVIEENDHIVVFAAQEIVEETMEAI
ncbi:Trk system potassium transporter TrkA [Halapricum hydrolyticum]|uniref:Trk system potassium transporter TrkA n=1 Tax=Halapricum hydrolyticum TaxID=2979991 RepID=A0AAE3LHK5_9EURY|nr:Trk system potassium transporter TrkA [Halapricum hydrolyticum]MCU4717006.1 Trk system potassium transporter TrkA [Halapricum hydrolyticum]MCU4725388.1 Trk system potassium transporter TrkA [Halapricum hydrolyticum]